MVVGGRLLCDSMGCDDEAPTTAKMCEIRMAQNQMVVVVEEEGISSMTRRTKGGNGCSSNDITCRRYVSHEEWKSEEAAREVRNCRR